jgi:hypothetical protein
MPRLQILTAAEILDNRRPQVPIGFTEGFRKAGQEKEDRQPKELSLNLRARSKRRRAPLQRKSPQKRGPYSMQIHKQTEWLALRGAAKGADYGKIVVVNTSVRLDVFPEFA